MNKEDLEDILRRLEVVSYAAETAEYIAVGPYRVQRKTDMSWELIGDVSARIFSTRMAALGYAKCLISKDEETAQRIRELDEEAGATLSQVECIRRASRNNDHILAKEQEAQLRHQENMQRLTRVVLDLI